MNLPNKLTVMRMVLVPFMIFFYLADFMPFGIGKLVALAIFIVASLTDLLDGKIARKRNLVTNFGKFLDPIADKLLTTSLLLLLVVDGTIARPYGVIIAIIIIAREFIVSGIRMLASNKGVVVAADMWGKLKTVVQMVALPVCLIYSYLLTLVKEGVNVVNWLELTFMYSSYILIVLATVLTIVSGINYLVNNKNCFKEEK